MLSGGGLGIIFDPYFLWQYGSALETGSASFTTPGSFLVFVLFVGVLILVSWDFARLCYTFVSSFPFQ